MSFRYQRIADFAHSDANNAADKTLAAAKPAPAASSRSRPLKDGAKVRTYDRSRDPKREKVRKTKTVRNPTPPRWRQFVQEKRSAGWDETASSLRDLSDFADYLLDQPTITSGASTLLSNAKSYLARSRGASVNQTDFNALFKVVKMQGVEKAGGTSVQALPVTIEDFGAFNDATDLAIFKLCAYLGVRATTVAKLEPITIVGKFAMFRVLVGTKKGVVHAGKFLLFSGSKAWRDANLVAPKRSLLGVATLGRHIGSPWRDETHFGWPIRMRKLRKRLQRPAQPVPKQKNRKG